MNILCSGPGPHVPVSGILGESSSLVSGVRCPSPSCAAPVDTVFETAQTNERTIKDRLETDLTVIDAIVATPLAEFTQAGLRDLQRQVKDLARINKRLIRLSVRLLDSSE